METARCKLPVQIWPKRELFRGGHAVLPVQSPAETCTFSQCTEKPGLPNWIRFLPDSARLDSAGLICTFSFLLLP